jgi:type I restriction enzyme M protein
MKDFKKKASFIWSIADILRGAYKPADYGTVILPFTVICRLDAVLAPTKQQVLAEHERQLTRDKARDKDTAIDVLETLLNNQVVDAEGRRLKFHNRSKFSFTDLADDAEHISENLRNYLHGYSASVREVVNYFRFDDQLRKLEDTDLLYQVVKKFAEPDTTALFQNVSSLEMGYIFEELIRKFAELSNETAGEHFTPREVIQLMVNLLFVEDETILTKPGILKTVYDPACGTGGMLSVAQEYVERLHGDAKLELFGQEINPESYAICKSDMLIKNQKPDNIKFGNTLTQDGLSDKTFDYMLSNPPFGVDWKQAEKRIKDEHDKQGWSGRFGAGLPPISDGSLLFLQHMVAKMKHNAAEGSRIAVVFNGSPLFSGGAGSGPSEIRRWLLERDMLEAIIALPDQLFYNTGIATYIWIVTNRKAPDRRGTVQLVNASGGQFDDRDNPFYVKMPRSLGNKRKQISEPDDDNPTAKAQITHITKLYHDNTPNRFCKRFDTTDFGYRRITIERPLRLRFQVRALETSEFDDLRKKGLARADMQEWLDTLREVFGETTYLDFNKIRKQIDGLLRSPALKAADEKLILKLLCQTDPDALPVRKPKAKPGEPPYEADPDLRDFENVPLLEPIDTYFDREVKPHVPDAWIDRTKRDERDKEVGIVGYEINFTRYFYEYKQPPSLAEIKAAILKLEEETASMISEIL